MIFIYLLIILISFGFFFGFVTFLIFEVIAIFTTDAPFVPIPKHVEEMIVDNLGLSGGSILYDLGCGDARVLVRAVQKYPTICAVGVEISFFPFLLAKFRTRKFPQISIRRENIFTTNISDATHIFVYLYPQVVNALLLKIQTDCLPGTVLMSCDFELANKKPDRVIATNDTRNKRGQKILIYAM